MEATDASRLVCVVVVSYQEYSLTHSLEALWVCVSLSRVTVTPRLASTHTALVSQSLV